MNPSDDKNYSATPRTDAVLPLGAAKNPEMPHIAIELAGLCRQLERELAEAKLGPRVTLQEIAAALGAQSAVAASFVPWDLETVKQEIRDLFARYGSGDYTPSEEEKEIIENALDEILTPPPVAQSATLARWIPVSERMPEEKQDVLAVWENDIEVVYHFNGDWWRLEGGLLRAPSYWMPLPSAPPDSCISKSTTEKS